MTEPVTVYWDRLPFCVYRMHSSDGSLLYVGATKQLSYRMARHRRHSEWWPLVEVEFTVVDGFATRDGASQFEALLIRTRRPPFNAVDGHYPLVDPIRGSTNKDSPEYLQALAALSEHAALVEAGLKARPALIRQARAGGVRWEFIAEAAGVSRATVINLSKIGTPTD